MCVMYVEHTERLCSVLTRAGIEDWRKGPEGICMLEVRVRMHQRVHIGWRVLAEEKVQLQILVLPTPWLVTFMKA